MLLRTLDYDEAKLHAPLLLLSLLLSYDFMKALTYRFVSQTVNIKFHGTSGPAYAYRLPNTGTAKMALYI